MTIDAHSRLHRRLIDSLYVEAMLLADEARGYFDDLGRSERDSLDPLARVVFSCESMKVTTRLMHVIAWLLTQRAVGAGEIARRDALDPSRRLGDGPETNESVLTALPGSAQVLIVASVDLYRRVMRLDAAQTVPPLTRSPVTSLHDRLARAF